MNRLPAILVLILAVTIFMIGCATRSNPIVPEISGTLDHELVGNISPQTHLWGFWTINIDTVTGTVTGVQNRTAMFTANVTTFINSNPLSMNFIINEIIPGPDYVDVDINVVLSHPFPGMPMYDGYDIRGIFMGNGSSALSYNSSLEYSVLGSDQYMMTGIVDGYGAPDGYTRWFNLTEFSTGGMPMFSYEPGNLATDGFGGSATLNPFKYFADGLGPHKYLWDWLNGPSNHNGQFSSGATNERNYYLRFPTPDPNVVYGYAVIANWEGTEEEYHPSNTIEAVGCDVVDSSTVYYVDETTNGGDLILDLSVFDWGSVLSAGVMEDYNIILESTVLSTPYSLDVSEMTPLGGDENFSTYHVEIAADSVTGSDDNEYWVIVEYPDYDYKNDFGTTNLAGDDPLAAFFRFDLDVSSEANHPICDLVIDPSSPAMPFEGWGIFEFDASGSYDPFGTNLTFEWDFDNDGVFGDSFEGGTDDKPQKLFDFVNQDQVCVRLTNELGGSSECCVNVDITGYPSKNIELRSGVDAVDIAIDHTNGDLLVLYDDKSIYRHTSDGWYQTGTLYIQLGIHHPKIMYGLDMAPSRYLGIALTYVTDLTPGFFVYDPDQGFNQYFGQGPPAGPMDSYTMTAGIYQNDMGFIRGRTTAGIHNTLALRGTLDDGLYVYGSVHQYRITDGITIGIDRIYFQYIKGSESDAQGNYLWFLEDPDYYASRWELAMQGASGVLSYDNAYFGTGTQTDDDNGWNDARDLTRDNLNRYFVLDELSTGEPRVKAWTVDGNTTTSIGGFGDSDTISGAPLRIEGSDYDGIIVVLHGDTSPDMISIFFPIEMPG